MALIKKSFQLACLAVVFATSGCASKNLDILNPFANDGPDTPLGELSLKPIVDDASGESSSMQARKALETMASYDRAQAPQPYKPVMRSAEVRLMWVPDHVNKSGDLIPAHYYYLRVLPPRWNVQDAFDIEESLNVKTRGGSGGATPWVYSESK